MWRQSRFWAYLALAAGSLCLALAASKGPLRVARGPLGELASLLASLEWIRFDRGVGRGSWQEAYVHAGRALRLDGASVEGWSTLAAHYIFLRGSRENEPEGNQRVEWMQRGLVVLKAGERECKAPAELALLRGQYLAFWIAPLASDPAADLPWPGGAQAAWRAGVEALDQAIALGSKAAVAQRGWAQVAGDRAGYLE